MCHAYDVGIGTEADACILVHSWCSRFLPSDVIGVHESRHICGVKKCRGHDDKRAVIDVEQGRTCAKSFDALTVDAVSWQFQVQDVVYDDERNGRQNC